MTLCEKRHLQIGEAVEIENINELIDIANKKIDENKLPIRIRQYARPCHIVIEELTNGRRDWKITHKVSVNEGTSSEDVSFFYIDKRETGSLQHYLPYRNDYKIKIESVKDCINRIINK